MIRITIIIKFQRILRRQRGCQKTLDLGILRFSVACKLLIFNAAKIIEIGHLDFFDKLSRFPLLHLLEKDVVSLHNSENQSF